MGGMGGMGMGMGGGGMFVNPMMMQMMMGMGMMNPMMMGAPGEVASVSSESRGTGSIEPRIKQLCREYSNDEQRGLRRGCAGVAHGHAEGDGREGQETFGGD